MAFQPVPQTASVRFHLAGIGTGSLAGIDWFFTLYVRDTADNWDSANLLQLAQYGRDWYTAGKGVAPVPAKNLVNVDWTLVDVTATDLTQDNGESVVVTAAAPNGARAGPAAIPSAPAIVRFNGAPGGVPKRGRVFWSGLSEADIEGDEVLAAARTALADVFAAFRDNVNVVAQFGDLTWSFVLVSRNLGTVPDPSPPKVAVRRAVAVTNGVTPTFDVRQVIGAQRNRRLGE